MARFYRLVYNLLSLAMFMWVMLPFRPSRVLYFVPGVWSLVMYLAQAVITVFLIVCLRQTGIRNFIGISGSNPTLNSDYPLVTKGFYSIARHPLYILSILFLVLNPVMTVQWLLLTILSTVYFIIGGLIEEHRLMKEFGEEYVQYRQRVPFIIPAFYRKSA